MIQKYFGTDGIRGFANKFPMTPSVALKAAMALGTIFYKKNIHSRVVIGKDTRLSSYMIESALVAGFTAAGMDVFLLGPIPTPATAMLCRSLRADVGVMISASHNPFYDNGIKLFGPDGYKLSDELEKKIESLIEKDLSNEMATNQHIGRAKRVAGDIYRYIEAVKRTMDRNVRLDGLRIVIDCANGAAYKAAPLALWELGAEVITIHNQPNGLNINLKCGSTHPASLVEKVKEVRADIGIALDGDGDRVLLVDENGEIIDGDQVIATISKFWLETKRLKGNTIVGTIMSNLGLEHFLKKEGLNFVRTQVGDRFVMEYMRLHGFNVGGEQSGHIILSDYNTTGDGLVAALQILNIAQNKQKKISEICSSFEVVPQILTNVKVKDKNILQDVNIKKEIQKIENKLKGSGRFIVRPSGTEPLIRIMAEGNKMQELEDLVNSFTYNLKKIS